MLAGARVVCAAVLSPGLGSSAGQPRTDHLRRHRGGSRLSQVHLLAGEAGWELAPRGSGQLCPPQSPLLLSQLCFPRKVM